jgi:hypothetical protein
MSYSHTPTNYPSDAQSSDVYSSELRSAILQRIPIGIRASNIKHNNSLIVSQTHDKPFQIRCDNLFSGYKQCLDPITSSELDNCRCTEFLKTFIQCKKKESK